MVKIENRCCDCATGLYPCTVCDLRHYRAFYCDWCKEEQETLYRYNGEEVCLDCIVADLTEVE